MKRTSRPQSKNPSKSKQTLVQSAHTDAPSALSSAGLTCPTFHGLNITGAFFKDWYSDTARAAGIVGTRGCHGDLQHIEVQCFAVSLAVTFQLYGDYFTDVNYKFRAGLRGIRLLNSLIAPSPAATVRSLLASWLVGGIRESILALSNTGLTNSSLQEPPTGKVFWISLLQHRWLNQSLC
ncbi:hypothetical protein FKM82_016205 [Ascaphus truei]